MRAYIATFVPHWADGDDVLQATAAIIWRKLDDFEPGTHFIKWALRIAHFEILKYHKQRKSRLQFSEETLEALAEPYRTFVAEDDRESEALQQCLGKLTARDRELVRLRYAHDATVKAIAQRVGRSPRAVYKALNRIHSQLLDCVRRTSLFKGNTKDYRSLPGEKGAPKGEGGHHGPRT